MKRRTQKKRISTHKKRSTRKLDKTKRKYRVSRKSSRKTRTKRKISRKKVKQTGGGTGNILTILDILLSKDLIKALKEKITDLTLTLFEDYASTQLYHIYLYVLMCLYLF